MFIYKKNGYFYFKIRDFILFRESIALMHKEICILHIISISFYFSFFLSMSLIADFLIFLSTLLPVSNFLSISGFVSILVNTLST